MREFFLTLSLFLVLSGCTPVKPNLVIETTPVEEPSSLSAALPLPATTLNRPEIVISNQTIPANIQPNIKLPTKMDLDPDFASQAPTGDWGLPYQEACEEAALIIASKYFSREKLDNEIMAKEIVQVVAWEKENLATYTDTNLAEVKKIAAEYFQLSPAVMETITVESMKQELAAGSLLLVPTAGRQLGNPYYSGAGPVYHFLVVRGYDRDEFITNDVGTKRGDGYKYKYQTLIDAIHDLPLKADGSVYRPFEENDSDLIQTEQMLTGAKRVLVIKNSSRN